MYTSTLCAHQPQRGPDMLVYLFIVASAQQEFTFFPCLAYDVAFLFIVASAQQEFTFFPCLAYDVAFLFIVASAQQEFTFTPCLAYDVAFHKKAARLRLPTWGQLDPQLRPWRSPAPASRGPTPAAPSASRPPIAHRHAQ